MHDIVSIRNGPIYFDAAMARRGLPPIAQSIIVTDKKHRAAITAYEQFKAELNIKTKQIGMAKSSGDTDRFKMLRSQVGTGKNILGGLKGEISLLENQLNDMLLALPNLPLGSIPDGDDESDNVELYRNGIVRKFDFPPKEHYDVLAAKSGLDFKTASKLSGSRFVILKGSMNRLHRALGQFMLDTHVDQNGFTEMWTPVLVRDEAMYGSGQLPKFADDSYRTENGWWLIPTAEVTLVNSEAGNIIDESALPIRLTAHSQCFRSEAGSAGRDTAGMLRQHQFEKVEMVAFTKPEDSAAELERMTKCAEGILDILGIPYRTIELCAGDLGFGMRKTYDIEAWLPGQNKYREISSCSTAGDFQARRMNTKYKDSGKNEYVHTLNGSGLAIGRTMIAIIENYQQSDGSIIIPAALQSYMNATRITPLGTCS